MFGTRVYKLYSHLFFLLSNIANKNIKQIMEGSFRDEWQFSVKFKCGRGKSRRVVRGSLSRVVHGRKRLLERGRQRRLEHGRQSRLEHGRRCIPIRTIMGRRLQEKRKRVISKSEAFEW